MTSVTLDVSDTGLSSSSDDYASAHRGVKGRDKGPSATLDLNNKPLPSVKDNNGNGTSIDPNLVQGNIKRGRGRPRKGEITSARISKWIPKTWTPIYEEIVSLDCMGMPQKEIAKKFNFTAVMISKICSTPQAKIFRRMVLETLAKRNKVFQEERFERSQVRAMERISSLMEDDELMETDPFAVVDRAFKLLEKTKVLGGGEKVGDINVTVNNLSQTAIVELKDGLAKAREAKELHSDMEAIDVTSPIVERTRITGK